MSVEKEKSGLTISEMINIIWKKKVAIIIATILIGLIGALGVKFAYNPGKKIYTSIVNYSFPAEKTGLYPDGTVFNYHDVVSKSVLEEVKNSDESYSNIDIDSLVNNNGIEIIKTIDENDYIIESTYTLNILQSYFKSKNQAANFINDLISYPINTALSKMNNLNYSNYLVGFDLLTDYNNQISTLKSQKDYVINLYNSLITQFGDFVVDGQTKLSDRINNINTFFNNNPIDTLENELNQNGYVKDLSLLNKITIEKNQLNIEKDDNTKKINDLLDIIGTIQGTAAAGSTNIFETYNATINSLVIRNVEIDRRIKVIDDQITTISSVNESVYDETKKITFENNLKNIKDNLTTYTNEFKTDNNFVYKSNNNLYYELSSNIMKKGGISVILAGAVFLVVGFIGASVVEIMITSTKKKENEPTIK